MTFCLNKTLNWLYIDMNSYFATIEQQLNPDIRNKPVAIVPLLSDSTCAIAASYEAKQKGIKTGTLIHQAKKLCPDLICIKARQSVYANFHHKIFEEIDKHLKVDYIFSIDEGACLLTGKYCKEEEAISIAKLIKESIKQNVGDYINCSIGIAPNRYLAKIASNLKKPDGLSIIRSNDLPQVLYQLKLTDIPGIGKKLHTRLSNQGILTMEQLCRFDSAELRAIWGSIWGEKVWHLIRGVDSPPQETKTTSISQSRVLAPELRNITGARNVLLALTFKAATRLRAMNLFTNHISVYLKSTNTEKLVATSKIASVNNNHSLISTLLNLFDNLVEQKSTLTITQVNIAFNNLHSETGQLSFELGANNLKHNKLSQMIDFINKRHGNNSVRIGLLQDKEDIQDAAAFGYIPKEK